MWKGAELGKKTNAWTEGGTLGARGGRGLGGGKRKTPGHIGVGIKRQTGDKGRTNEGRLCREGEKTKWGHMSWTEEGTKYQPFPLIVTEWKKLEVEKKNEGGQNERC